MSVRQLRILVSQLFRSKPEQVYTAAGICHLLRNRISPAPVLSEIETLLENGVRNGILDRLREGEFGAEYRLKARS